MPRCSSINVIKAVEFMAMQVYNHHELAATELDSLLAMGCTLDSRHSQPDDSLNKKGTLVLSPIIFPLISDSSSLSLLDLLFFYPSFGISVLEIPEATSPP